MHAARALIAVLATLAGACGGSSSQNAALDESDAHRAAREPPRPDDIEVPPEYRVEVVAERLTFPTGIAFGDHGETWIVEAGYAYDKLATARIVALDPTCAPLRG